MDAITLVLDASGKVIRADVGSPSEVDVSDGERSVLRDGPAAEAWIGWTRASDGRWIDPRAPVTDTAETLSAYVRLRSYDLEVAGITLAGMSVSTTRESQGLISRAVALLDADPSLTSVDYDTGVAPVTLPAAQVRAVGIAVGRHVQAAFAKRATALRGISAGTVTTRAQVDAILAAA